MTTQNRRAEVTQLEIDVSIKDALLQRNKMDIEGLEQRVMRSEMREYTLTKKIENIQHIGNAIGSTSNNKAYMFDWILECINNL